MHRRPDVLLRSEQRSSMFPCLSTELPTQNSSQPAFRTIQTFVRRDHEWELPLLAVYFHLLIANH